MEKEIKVEDLSREQLENIARIVLDKKQMSELINKSIRQSAEKSKLIGLEKLQWKDLLTGLIGKKDLVL